MSEARVLYVAEPPAKYRLLPPLVVDSSVLAALLFAEPEAAQARRLTEGGGLNAPDLLRHEIANVAVNKRRGGETEAAVAEALAAFEAANVQLHTTNLEEQVALAQRYNLSAYDAAYLWLAAELQAPLVTFDRQLAKAATAHLGQL